MSVMSNHSRAVAAVTLPLSAFVLAVSVTTGPVFASVPGRGNDAAGTAAQPQDVSAAAAWDREQVRRLADKDPRWEVQSAAWTALLSSDPAAVGNFLAPGGGYELAKSRAAKNAARNDMIISRTLATTTPRTSPMVFAAATRASRGTLAMKDQFVRVGLEEAQQQDAEGIGNGEKKAEEQALADRQYVARLAAEDPGHWVRAAADRAIVLGTNDDIAEFFRSSWASAAGCDLQAFRLAIAEHNARFRVQVKHLITLAEEAQKAYESASEAAKEKAADTAKSAWFDAANSAATAQAKWVAEQQLAAEQARSWSAVRDFALTASTQQDWPRIAAQASTTSADWSAEVAWAQEQGRQWSAMAELALANAKKVTPTNPTTLTVATQSAVTVHSAVR